MNTTTLQLTIRGLDPATKAALVRKANQQGISLNRYAATALRRSAGIDEQESRYHTMKEFLSTHHISGSDKKTFDRALEWLDKVSMEKQKRDDSL